MRASSQGEVLRVLHRGLRDWMQQAHWQGLRPVQIDCFMPIYEGHDCLIEAPTSGGKTEAVLFPTLTRAAANRAGSVQILYLAPLKALLNDIEVRAEKYSEACSVHCFKWHGDVSHQVKLDQLRQPPQLLLTTPESMEAILLRRAEWPSFFADLRVVIIDEAHNFAAGNRGGHLMSVLARLERKIGHDVQRIALTATVGNPERLQQWLAGHRQPGSRIVGVGASPSRDVELRLYPDPDGEHIRFGSAVARRERLGYTASVIQGRKSLVFVRSRAKAEESAQHLQDLSPGLRARTHHSAVSSYFRELAEDSIKLRSDDAIDAIISTQTLELGIDIGDLDRVIQLGLLASPSSLLQRMGRTGRRSGQSQRLSALLVKTSELPLMTAVLNLALAGTSEALRLPTRAFHLMAHQLLTLSLQEHGVPLSTAWEVLSSAHCFHGITKPELVDLVKHMIAEDYLRLDDGVVLVGERAEREMLGSNWRQLFAVFDSAPLYDVIHGKKHVGTLSAGFVEALEVPFHFILASRVWVARSVSRRGRQVRVQPAAAGHAPRWESFGGPDIPFETAQETGRLLCSDELPAFLDQEASDELEYQQRQAQDAPWRPGSITIEPEAATARITTFGGDQVNRALARLLESEGIGEVSCNYRRLLVRRSPLGRNELRKAIEGVLESLAAGPLSDAEAVRSVLESRQRPRIFSMFARCLPPHLCSAALVDQTLDAERLLEVAQTSGW